MQGIFFNAVALAILTMYIVDELDINNGSKQLYYKL